LESRADIVAYTDDDVIVDRGWARAIASAFGREPDAMAVTGLVVPHETDTEAQVLFEQYGGFGRGVRRRYAQIDLDGAESAAPMYCGTGQFGTGANMAFRRRVFDSVGLFDPALDVGTVTNGGGDLDMLYRVLAAGHLLIYEPTAIVRHRHRRDIEALRNQLANNGIGYYAYLVRNVQARPGDAGRIVRHGLWWFAYWSLRRWFLSVVRPGGFPRDLITAELHGSIAGLTRYRTAVKEAVGIVREFGPQQALEHEEGRA
jgi:GT2 family glycosyltransferase